MNVYYFGGSALGYAAKSCTWVDIAFSSSARTRGFQIKLSGGEEGEREGGGKEEKALLHTAYGV